MKRIRFYVRNTVEGYKICREDDDKVFAVVFNDSQLAEKVREQTEEHYNIP